MSGFPLYLRLRSAGVEKFSDSRRKKLGAFPATFQRMCIFRWFSYVDRLSLRITPDECQKNPSLFLALPSPEHHSESELVWKDNRSFHRESSNASRAGNITWLCRNISAYFYPFSDDVSVAPDCCPNCAEIFSVNSFNQCFSLAFCRNCDEICSDVSHLPDIWRRNFQPKFVVMYLIKKDKLNKKY